MTLQEIQKICVSLSRSGLRKNESFTRIVEGLEFSVHVVSEDELGHTEDGYLSYTKLYKEFGQGNNVRWTYIGFSSKHRRGSLVCVRGDRHLIEGLDEDPMDFDDSIPF